MGKAAMKILGLKDEEFYEVQFFSLAKIIFFSNAQEK
jgi:hypothetical protein